MTNADTIAEISKSWFKFEDMAAVSAMEYWVEMHEANAQLLAIIKDDRAAMQEAGKSCCICALETGHDSDCHKMILGKRLGD